MSPRRSRQDTRAEAPLTIDSGEGSSHVRDRSASIRVIRGCRPPSTIRVRAAGAAAFIRGSRRCTAQGRATIGGLLATAVGAVLVLLFSLAMNLIGPFSGAGPLLGNAFPWPSSDGAIQAFTMSLQTGIGALVRQAPVVLLVVVMAWLWLQKHPSEQAVSADTAEV